MDTDMDCFSIFVPERIGVIRDLVGNVAFNMHLIFMLCVIDDVMEFPLLVVRVRVGAGIIIDQLDRTQSSPWRQYH